MFRNVCIVAFAFSMMACSTSSHTEADVPEWLEADSASAIHQRLLRDFPYSFDEALVLLSEKYPSVTADSLRAYIDLGYVEAMDIDGEQRIFRKAPRNLGLLNPALNSGWKHRGYDASPERISYADSIVRFSKGNLPLGGAHRVRVRFSIDVPYNDILAADTLRVWMPFPISSGRQSQVKLISSVPEGAVVSAPEQSAHCTLYLESPVAKDDTTHFEYVAEFVTAGQYFAPEAIEAALKPYDKTSDLYQRFTALDSSHYVRLDSLASLIVGSETNPFRQSEIVYNYIISRYPWAGAREYSTIPCIPRYVVEQGHGDCGQVALLYISLMRTLGVPARWESGWMLHPGEKNFHDWAEVYFEGVGWVPVDVSFGRYTTSSDPAVRNFYSTGIDSYRMATNTDIAAPFFPQKRYIRSETVDCQAGEVECTKGNLFFPAWDQSLEILSVTPE